MRVYQVQPTFRSRTVKNALLVMLVSLVVSAAALAARLRRAPQPIARTFSERHRAPIRASTHVWRHRKRLPLRRQPNASQKCKAERDGDAAAFATAHGGKSFAAVYGADGNTKNAFGKCVSAKADKATAAEQAAELNAAKQCKAWGGRIQPSQRATAASFADFYGTNANKKNAFGKCVSKLTKAHELAGRG